MPFRKPVSRATIDREAALQARAAACGLAPRVVGVERGAGGAARDVLVMDAVDGASLADALGGADAPAAGGAAWPAPTVDDALWARVVALVRALRDDAGVYFLDCTPYNFMLDSAGDLWAVDFGDARLVEEGDASGYVEALVEGGVRSWNDEFR